MRFLRVIAAVMLPLAAMAQELTVTTFAGSDGGNTFRDAVGTAARFDTPMSVAVDGSGNVYVAENSQYTVRKIAPDGTVRTLAGVADLQGITNGIGGAARFGQGSDVEVDGSGNTYVADGNLRKISPNGVVSTLASLIGFTDGMVVDADGNVFFVDLFGQRIRKVTPGGTVSTFVMTGGETRGLAIDGSGNLYYTTGSGLYKVTPLGAITLVTADIPLSPGVAVDASGTLYVAKFSSIVKVTQDGVVTPFAGSIFSGSEDGTGENARFNQLSDIAISADGSLLYASDISHNTIRRITVPGAVVTTFAGKRYEAGFVDANGTNARFSNPSGGVYAPDGNFYVADTGTTRIRRITPAGDVTTFAGSTYGDVDATGIAAQFKSLRHIAVAPDGGSWALYAIDADTGKVRKITSAGVVTTVATGLTVPFGIAVSAAGDLYVSEFGGNTIKKIAMPSGTVTIFAGAQGMEGDTDATGTAARFRNPAGIAVDGSGNLFVADYSNNKVRQIVLATAEVTTFAGSTGALCADDERFDRPLAVLPLGSDLYVADATARIRKIASGGGVTILAGKCLWHANRDGTGSFARFNSIFGLATDGTDLYVVNSGGQNIRRLAEPIDDVATVSDSTPAVGVAVQLDTDPDTATSWQWSIHRRPAGSTAELSSTSIRNPTFTPDVGDLYTLLLRAESASGVRYSTVDIFAEGCADPLGSIVASVTDANVCISGSGATASVAVSGGGNPTYQWGIRTTSGGVITPIGGATSSAYILQGSDFGSLGTKYLVVTVTPSCGSAVVSNQLTINVTATPDATISASSGVFANSTQNFASVADAGAGATYTWGITNGTIDSGQGTRQISYTAGASGNVNLQVTVSLGGCAPSTNVNVPIVPQPAGATMLYIVTPCRIADTRGGAALAPGSTREFQISGLCGIPAGVKAVAANVTALSPPGSGFLSFFPAGTVWPGNSTMIYRPGKTRANNTIVVLSNDGRVNVYNSEATVDIIIDVSGYFR